MLGLYIDSLPADARDRIIKAQNWTSGTFSSEDGDRCLLGHVEDWRGVGDNAYAAAPMPGWFISGTPTRFDALAERFGLDRVVRACKARAARGNAPRLEAVTCDLNAVAADVAQQKDDLADLRRLFDTVGFAASTEETRLILNNILLDVTGDSMMMTATNGHRLANATAVGATSLFGADSASLLLPRRAADLLRRAFGPKDVVQVAASKSRLLVETDTVRLHARLADDRYPDWRQVMPKEDKGSASASKLALVAAVQRARAMASDQTHRIILEATPGRGLTLSAKTPGVGTYSEDLACQVEGLPFRIGFNAEYLLEVIRRAPGARVRLLYTSPDRAAQVEGEPEESFAASLLVMPLRLLEDVRVAA